MTPPALTLEQTLQERSRQQAAMTALMLKLRADYQRWESIETLGRKTEKDALQEASRHLTKAPKADILTALQELEGIKGKKYSGSVAYAGIDETLHQGGITRAELPEWLSACKKATFCSGHRYQPLPSHDEAWHTYSKVHGEMQGKRWAAEILKYRTTPVTILDAEAVQAAEWGFWDDMSINLKRRLFMLLPVKKRESIMEQYPLPQQRMQQTRIHYDKVPGVLT
jgi:hypothetical protein